MKKGKNAYFAVNSRNKVVLLGYKIVYVQIITALNYLIKAKTTP